MGQKEKAFEYVWNQVSQTIGESFEQPVPVDFGEMAVTNEELKSIIAQLPIEVVCVKYGTKYGADYVNKLYNGIQRHLTLDHTFSCFTENPEGLDTNITVKPFSKTGTVGGPK